MISRTLRNRFEFFRNWAPYIVGEKAKGALDLARAEEVLWDENLVPVWKYEPGEGWCCVLYTPDDPMAFDPEPNVALAAIGGLEEADFNSNEYRRVIHAELARESIPMLAKLDTD